MLLEMHCHTAEHSTCSKVPAVQLVRRVLAKGLQGLVLTDHHYLWSDSDLEELRRQSEVPPDFILLSAQETNVPVFGDVLIYGASATIRRGTTVEEIRRQFPEAALVWAHPYRDGRIPRDDQLISPYLSGIEIFNSNHQVHENSRGLQDWRRLNFTATSGTDTHAASYAGIYPTVFDRNIRSIGELAAAIRKGECRPFMKRTSHREEDKVASVTIGTVKPDRTRETLIVRTPPHAEAWDAAERAFHVMSAVSQMGFDGGRFRVPQPLGKDAGGGTIVERAVPGTSLFDKMVGATGAEAEDLVRMSAQWLARLRQLRLRITRPEEFLREETRRLNVDVARFMERNHPYRNKLADLVTAVKTIEQAVRAEEMENWLQGHGDFQPKNIIIGSDGAGPEKAIYLAAIDFERTQVMPPAFDVGWFLAQAQSQFAEYPALAGMVEETFFAAYQEEAAALLSDDFWRQVELFRARTNISIAAFLVKMGVADATKLWRVLVEAERAMTYVV